MWFIPALITIICWGTADLYYKKANPPHEAYSAIKTVILVGCIMGVHFLGYYILYLGISYKAINFIKYLPVSLSYIISMAIGYWGLKYIELSIASPISNASGAVSALLTFLIFGATMNLIQFSAILTISISIILLAFIEHRQEVPVLEVSDQDVFKYRFSPWAILLPILYCLIDGLGTFLDGYYLEFGHIMSEDQANMSYELTFFLLALILWFYLERVKKHPVRIFYEREKTLAAVYETIGQFFYIQAIASRAVIVAPMIASYSVVSVLLSRIFLKEYLSKIQYILITLILLAIFILGFYDS